MTSGTRKAKFAFPLPEGRITAFSVVNKRLIGDRIWNECICYYI